MRLWLYKRRMELLAHYIIFKQNIKERLKKSNVRYRIIKIKWLDKE